MSSETSTDAVPQARADQSLQPWHFFVLAALACATVLSFIVRGEGLTPVILLTVMMGAIALVGLTVLRTVRPLFGVRDDRTAMIGEKTRAGLEREKTLALRALKELEFDHQMGKVADEDFREMTARLRARALRLMKQLDAGAGYRERIEQDLAKRLKTTPPPPASAPVPGPRVSDGPPAVHAVAAEGTAGRRCAACSTANDGDAKFCKGCGQPL